jgi:PIN domain nuclease of toxin-antitoxin system
VSSGILLDTHALLWLVSGERLGEPARQMIREASASRALFVSAISAWEIATLIRKRRIGLSQDVEDWFENVLGIPGVSLADMDWRTLARSPALPGEPPNDPADRILIATARRSRMQLLTRDRQILDYAKAGHVKAVAC